MPTGNEFVSVVVPVRNEVEYIKKCLDSIINQDYPRDKYEVLVVDGMSTDGTRDVVLGYQRADGRVKLLDNPKMITPLALNIGVKNSVGGIIVRVDGHIAYGVGFAAGLIKLARSWISGKLGCNGL